MAVVGFSAHTIVASSATEEWVRARLSEGDLAAPMSPRFLAALGQHLGLTDDGVDVVLVADGLPGPRALIETDLGAHPRVARSQHHREDVRTFEHRHHRGRGVVVVGRGLARRTEVAVEVAEEHRGRGLARLLLVEARRLVSPDEVVFAQTAPAQAASLRALLAAGFRPIGSEALFL